MPLLVASSRFLRAARATALAAVATIAAGCDVSDDGLSPESVAGEYVLVSYEGRALPVTDVVRGVRTELLGGVLNLRGDRTFDMAVDSRETSVASGTVQTYAEVYSGRYTINGRVLTFSRTTNGELDGATATVSGSTVTYGRLVFRQ